MVGSGTNTSGLAVITPSSKHHPLSSILYPRPREARFSVALRAVIVTIGCK